MRGSTDEEEHGGAGGAARDRGRRDDGPGGAGRAPRGGVLPGERALAPDLARGMMLLLIVLSNTAFHLWAAQHGPSGWHPVDGSWPDRAVRFAMIVGLDLRAYPLFAFLFGYGMMQLFLRQRAHGTSERTAVALLRRRSLWLVVFGFAHAALLMAGDIIGSYGVASLVLVWLFIRRGDRVLLAGAAVFALLIAVPAAQAAWSLAAHGLEGVGGAGAEPSYLAYAAQEEDPLAAAGTRLVTWAFVTLAGGLLSFGGFAMILLGFWAAGLDRGDGGPLPAVQAATGLACGLGYVAGDVYKSPAQGRSRARPGPRGPVPRRRWLRRASRPPGGRPHRPPGPRRPARPG
ncbi:hypothetical protein MRI28_30265 [Nocardiopsis dassonvillei]|uniref:DUF418 domain-containing protein n=1 Tax=Nocardiopsis dassonvillei TaxID=2014 RepID=UPI00200CDF2C|nr:hypothetical protein [Nocardiopsis dassonvillei]MCK9873857.1 hypothetical protein [Nocardiopsis dassonvillei]